MPLDYSSIDTHRQTYIVRNLTNGIFSIGDLGITLQPYGSNGSSINLLGENNFTKKTFKTISEISSSQDLEIAIATRKVEIETEEGVLPNGDKIKSASLASLYDIQENRNSLSSSDVKIYNLTIPTSIWTSEIVDLQLNLGEIINKTSALLGFFSSLDSLLPKSGIEANFNILTSISTSNGYYNPIKYKSRFLGSKTASYMKVYEDYNNTRVSFELKVLNTGGNQSKVAYPGTVYADKLNASPAVTDGFKYSHSGYGILVGYLHSANTGVFGLNKRVQLVTAWLEQSGVNTICNFRFNNLDHPTAPTNEINMTVALYE